MNYNRLREKRQHRCVEPIKISKTYKNLQEIVFCVYFLLRRFVPLTEVLLKLHRRLASPRNSWRRLEVKQDRG